MSIFPSVHPTCCWVLPFGEHQPVVFPILPPWWKLLLQSMRTRRVLKDWGGVTGWKRCNPLRPLNIQKPRRRPRCYHHGPASPLTDSKGCPECAHAFVSIHVFPVFSSTVTGVGLLTPESKTSHVHVYKQYVNHSLLKPSWRYEGCVVIAEVCDDWCINHPLLQLSFLAR